MKAAMLLLHAAAALAGCASYRAETVPWTGPTYTRAGISTLSTDDLAARLLPPERAAAVVRHDVRRSVFHEGQDLRTVDFYQRPYSLAEDVCLRQVLMVSFADPAGYNRARMTQDRPMKVESVSALPDIALLRYCAPQPGHRFARLSGDLSLGEGVQILRSLRAARELAEGTQPLPFRLLCVPLRGEAAPCTAAERAAFAAIPLHTAYQIERRPGPASCRPEDALGGDLVLLDRDGPGFWQVRLIGLGGPEAAVVVSADGRRTACL
jgi:hypothetical protein